MDHMPQLRQLNRYIRKVSGFHSEDLSYITKKLISLFIFLLCLAVPIIFIQWKYFPDSINVKNTFISVIMFAGVYFVGFLIFLFIDGFQFLLSISLMRRLLHQLANNSVDDSIIEFVFNAAQQLHPEVLRNPSAILLLGYLLQAMNMQKEAEIFISKAFELDAGLKNISSRKAVFQYVGDNLEKAQVSPVVRIYKFIWLNKPVRYAFIGFGIISMLAFYTLKILSLFRD